MKKFKFGREINLLDLYPKSKRSFEARSREVTIADKLAARKFGKEYFDGTRNQGYGGYNYHPRFWQGVVRRMQKYYKLNSNSRILDIGCGKGFMLHDFYELIPGITALGIDISQYAIASALNDVKPFVQVGNAKSLPFADKSFDLVFAINTLHNLPLEECFQALREIERVSAKHKFIINDAWKTESGKRNLQKWNLTAITYFSINDWRELFKLAGYTGDYHWFSIE